MICITLVKLLIYETVVKVDKRGIHSGAFKIKTEQGPYCSHNEIGVEITFETKKAIEPVEYCPHPAYYRV